MNPVLVRGDLVRMPSNVKLFVMDESELKIIKDFKYTQSPKLGIFIKYTTQGGAVINTDGEQWVVEISSLRLVDKDAN